MITKRIKHFFRASSKKWYVFAALVVIIIAAVFLQATDFHIALPTTKFHLKRLAKKAVLEELQTPATADFCSYSKMTVKKDPEDEYTIPDSKEYTVTGYVDAQNIYGAFIRDRWTVEITVFKGGYEYTYVRFED